MTCLFDDVNPKRECAFSDSHEFWTGGRSECRNCQTYQKWHVDHKEEFELLISEGKQA